MLAPQPSLYKLPLLGCEWPVNTPRTAVHCTACNTLFPLTDYLDGELPENRCPNCKTHINDVWGLGDGSPPNA
jgi:DNA-directed RNA polymerase subunit RPC12/RpoP